MRFLGSSELIVGSAHKTGILSSKTVLLFEVTIEKKVFGLVGGVGFCPFACSGALNHFVLGNATVLVAVSRNWLHFYVK